MRGVGGHVCFLCVFREDRELAFDGSDRIGEGRGVVVAGRDDTAGWDGVRTHNGMAADRVAPDHGGGEGGNAGNGVVGAAVVRQCSPVVDRGRALAWGGGAGGPAASLGVLQTVRVQLEGGVTAATMP